MTEQLNPNISISDLYDIYLQCGEITTDSRNCPKGSLFFAIKGERFDGNQFAEKAIENGCAFAVIDNKDYQKDHRFILVDNVLLTLQALAREHRRHFQIPVIGITGTNGKTTTKELIAAVLSERYNVLFTQGNLNNDIGVPQTLFRLNKNHDIAVIEMGASHPEDIKRLAETAEPNFGIITNVGKAHLQGFGSFEGVIKTKKELFDFLRTREDSIAFLNASNPYLVDMAQGLAVVPYSSTENLPLTTCGSIIDCAPFVRFQWHEPVENIDKMGENCKIHEVKTHLIGSYNIDNLMAAITIGLFFSVTPTEICHALENYIPTNNRSQLENTVHNHLIIDAYNANPTSMKAALENFKLMAVSPKMAILGDMKELGNASLEEHQKIIELLKQLDLTDVWLVGDEFSRTTNPFRTFRDVEAVKDALNEQLPEGKYILVKGSNSMRLAQLKELL